jgi:hypothetical protein
MTSTEQALSARISELSVTIDRTGDVLQRLDLIQERIELRSMLSARRVSV